MNKRMFWMLVAVIVVFGGIFGFKWFGNKMMNQFFDNMPQPPATVSAAEAQRDSWAQSIEAVGTVRAVNGTELTTEVGGIVEKINFESGDRVEAGTVLLTLDSKTDAAQLKALDAAAQLAELELKRFERLYKLESVSKADLDRKQSEAEQARAQAAAQREKLAQKTIRAPFAGELGIRKVDLGQYVAPGTPIVSLQALSPIYVDFTLPEQQLDRLEVNLPVQATVDAYGNQDFTGTINAVAPEIDAQTRNFAVQARFDNADRKLRPGMFARVAIQLGQSEDVVVVPQTAISFNPYGNSVYVVTEAEQQADGQGSAAGKDGAQQGPKLIVKRRFVKTGRTRGDLIAVTDGLKPGERVATSGLLKLRNDGAVTINNEVRPESDATPKPANS